MGFNLAFKGLKQLWGYLQAIQPLDLVCVNRGALATVRGRKRR